jgi:mannan endo-1,4-beta-mannosidase
VIPFVNNWASFGGMDQYVRWAGASYHSDFYTDQVIRGWYRGWVAHLLERTNIHTGVQYKNEPTIAVWELANEPRCSAAGQYPKGPDCTTATITAWATEMAAHVKSIDRRHLLGLGDEGFLCDPGTDHFAYDCSQGVDGEAIARLPDIDLVGLHLYPDHWRTDARWATEYIRRHARLADDVGKPLFLGEYGWRGAAPRNAVFHEWLTAFQSGGGDIALYWQMQPRSELSTPADSDGFTAYCPSAVCTQVNYRSQAMSTGRTDFPPVADVDFLSVAAGGAGSVDLLANDVSPFSRLDPDTVDVDPATAGVQHNLTTPSGTLEVSGGTLTFTPAAEFTGRVDFSYSVSDVDGMMSELTTGVIRTG